LKLDSFIVSMVTLAVAGANLEAATEAIQTAAGQDAAFHWPHDKALVDPWRHKENSTFEPQAGEGKRAGVHRWRSGFAPFTFTWATLHFKKPLDMADAAAVRFWVKGDGSGHRLQFQFGAPGPQGRGTLYYINTAEAVTLNFKGWRECTASLARFVTPTGGDPVRDLGQVVFAQFMITRASHGAAALDIQLGDFRIVRDSAKQRKIAALRKQKQMEEAERARREELEAQQNRAALDEAAKTLPGLRKQVEALPSEPVGAARKRAVLLWLVEDVETSVAAGLGTSAKAVLDDVVA
jgi:hypothetical protein